MSERDDLIESMLTAEETYRVRAREEYSAAVIAFLERFGAPVAPGKFVHPPFRTPSGAIVQPVIRKNRHGRLVGYLIRRSDPEEFTDT